MAKWSPHAKGATYSDQRSGRLPSCAAMLLRIDEDRGLQLVRQEDEFGTRTVVQFVLKCDGARRPSAWSPGVPPIDGGDVRDTNEVAVPAEAMTVA